MKTQLSQIELEQKLATYDGEDRVLSAQDVLKDYRENAPKGERYESKIPTLDKTIGGFYTGQLIVISGLTGQGKTTLAQTFTRNMSEQLVYPLWFSYEVSCDDFLSVFPADHMQYIFMPLKLKDNTLQWLEERILESRLKHRTTAVFIDHIHYLIQMNARQNMSFVIGETVRGLKQIALKYNVVIFLIAHMTKTKPDEEPGLGSVRDCLPGDQEIYLSDGRRVRVDQLKQNDKVVSYRSIKTLQEDTVEDVWDAGDKEIFEISTSTGRKIRCSDGHKFYAMTKKKASVFGPGQGVGIRGWTPLRDLEIGTKIAVVRQYPDVTGEDTLTESQAMLLGWIAGDGHITKRHSSEVTVSTMTEVNYLKVLAGKGFDLSPSHTPYADKKAFRFYLSNGGKKNKLAEFFRDRHYCPIGSNKYVLEDIFRQSKKVVAAYLRGLFQADGSINRAGVEGSEMIVSLHTISDKMAHQVKHLLLRLGIVCHIRKQTMKNSGFRSTVSDSWQLTIFGPNIVAFMDQIGFVAEKQERALRTLQGWKPKRTPFKGDICFERIKSIELIGVEKTFDIQVRGHHASLRNNSFCVEDFITHNSSFIEQEADTVLYVWRLKDDRWVTVAKVAKNRKRGIIDEKVGLILKDGKYVETTLSEEK